MTESEPDRDRRDRLEALLLQALDLPQERHARFAAEHCADDPSLARELLDLLGCADDSDLPSEHDSPDPRVAIGDRQLAIPGYRIESVLGSGGMGVVYRAVQEQLGRPVALKVVHPIDGQSPEAIRLEREAELLARLHHPGIAQIHEAGIAQTALGAMPWFAMELVDGDEPLTWARKTDASIRARVELFIALCEAVQHAHDRGVVHRDLKPGNVLVINDSERHARPKILDFGIARDLAAEPAAPDDRRLTRTGHFVGTVPYMSPEQLRGSTVLDARADVYALGVLLYELLTGRLPLDLRGRSLTELTRIVLDEEPARIGAHDRRLRGDLEIVCVVALEKDRNRRYPSAQALADDLRRYLADEPIVARPPGRWTRIRRFSRRHRTLVATTATITLALSAGLVGMLEVARSNALQAATERQLRHAADDATRDARRNLYFAQMAATSLAEDATGVRTIQRQLHEWLPGPDGNDFRGWEWHAMRGMTREPVASQTMRGFVMHISAVPGTSKMLVSGDGFCQEFDLTTLERRDLPRDPGSKTRAVVPSHDGALAAAAGSGGVTVWRLADLEVLARIELPDWGSNIAFHPDGKRLAVLTFKAGLMVFDWTTGERLHHLPSGLHGDALRIDFSPDGRLLALSRSDGNVLVLATNDWSVHADLPAPDTNTHALRFSHDGRSLATGHGDGTIQVLDVATWQRRRHLQRHMHGITTLAWSPDDQTIVSASPDRVIRTWNVEGGHQCVTFSGHDNNVEALDLSADGHYAVSGCRDRQLRIWDLTLPAARAQLSPAQRFSAFYVTDLYWRDEDHVALSHKNLRELWRVADRQRVERSEALGLGRYRASPDGRWFAGGKPDGGAAIWSQTDPEGIRHTPLIHRPEYFPAWHPNSDRVAFSTENGLWLWRLDRETPELWIPEVHAQLATGWSQDGRLFATHSYGRVALHDGETGVALQTWSDDAHNSRFGTYRLGIDATADRVATCNSEGRIRVWQRGHSEPIELAGHDQSVTALTWNPDGSRLASASLDHSVKIWEPQLGRLAATFRLPQAVMKAAWSPSGERLAAVTGAADLHVWDAGPGRRAEAAREAQRRAEEHR